MVPGFLTFFPVILAVSIGLALFQVTRPQLQFYSTNTSSPPKPPPISPKKNKKSQYTCELCGESIYGIDVNLTKLTCDHQFHKWCISANFKRCKDASGVATCPVSGCIEKYSLAA